MALRNRELHARQLDTIPVYCHSLDGATELLRDNAVALVGFALSEHIYTVRHNYRTPLALSGIT